MLIGLSGKKGSGKSTVAKALSTEHGFARRPFAFYLKAMLSALGIRTEVLEGTDKEKSEPLPELGGKTARHAMQTLGTEWGRDHMGEDFWLRRWLRGYNPDVPTVVEDVRFTNEAEQIQALGGVIVEVHRPDSDPVIDEHLSERGGLPADYVLVNDGDKKKLSEKVGVLLGVIKDRD